MRERKFRAWSLRHKKWVNDEFIIFADGTFGLVDPFCWDGGCTTHEDYCGDKALAVMQYTGLKDKNGKEIYQSDLLKKNDFEGLWEVVWNDDSPGYFITNGKIRMPMSKLCQPLIEIIGNLYETPELLKDSQND